jgi:hypothetical protein
MPDQAKPVVRPWQRFLRFSVRGLIVVVLVIGIWMGWLVRSATIQREAVAAIQKNAGGFVIYNWQWNNGSRRFEQMRTGQTKHISKHGTVEFSLHDPRHTQRTAPPPRRVSGAELGEARRKLCDATYQFLIRCFNEGLIEEDLLRRTCSSLDLGVEATDLRQRTQQGRESIR